MLSSLIIDRLNKTAGSPSKIVLYLYMNHGDVKQQTLIGLLGYLLKQVVREKDSISKPVYEAYMKSRKRGIKPIVQEMFEFLSQELLAYSQIWIIVDALDEAGEDVRELLLNRLFDIDPDRLKSFSHGTNHWRRCGIEDHTL